MDMAEYSPAALAYAGELMPPWMRLGNMPLRVSFAFGMTYLHLLTVKQNSAFSLTCSYYIAGSINSLVYKISINIQYVIRYKKMYINVREKYHIYPRFIEIRCW